MTSEKKNGFRNRLYRRRFLEGNETESLGQRGRGVLEGLQDRGLEIGKAVRVYDIVEPPVDLQPNSSPELQW